MFSWTLQKLIFHLSTVFQSYPKVQNSITGWQAGPHWVWPTRGKGRKLTWMRLDSLSLREKRTAWPCVSWHSHYYEVPCPCSYTPQLRPQEPVKSVYPLTAYSNNQMFISNSQRDSPQREYRVGRESGVLWFDCPFPNLCYLIATVTVFRGGTFKRWLGIEGSVITGVGSLLWE